MKRKELERFIGNIMSKVEVLEYTENGEEGNIYFDKFARQFLLEYSQMASKDQLKDLLKYFKKVIK